MDLPAIPRRGARWTWTAARSRAGAMLLAGALACGCRASGSGDAGGTASPPLEEAFPPGEWVPLFDGSSLAGWRIVDDLDFEEHGEVAVRDGTLILGAGNRETGISRRGPFPRDGYEVELEAMRVEGSDFFCGMTFPVADSYCTLIVGGWGGTVVGLSNVDGMHAAENMTTTGDSFENGRWYRIRLRVTPAKIEVWIDGDQVIDLERAGHTFDIWWEQEPVRPFGIATYSTAAALRAIRARRL